MVDSQHNQIVLHSIWTTCNQFWGCKNFSDHYNATPSLEAMIARCKALKSDLVWIVCAGYFALINFARPADLLRDSNQVLVSPLHPECEEELKQSMVISLMQ
jgi:hypothetical protein